MSEEADDGIAAKWIVLMIAGPLLAIGVACVFILHGPQKHDPVSPVVSAASQPTMRPAAIANVLPSAETLPRPAAESPELIEARKELAAERAHAAELAAEVEKAKAGSLSAATAPPTPPTAQQLIESFRPFCKQFVEGMERSEKRSDAESGRTDASHIVSLASADLKQTDSIVNPIVGEAVITDIDTDAPRDHSFFLSWTRKYVLRFSPSASGWSSLGGTVRIEGFTSIPASNDRDPTGDTTTLGEGWGAMFMNKQ